MVEPELSVDTEGAVPGSALSPDDIIAAYEQGDYVTALEGFRNLAERGQLVLRETADVTPPPEDLECVLIEVSTMDSVPPPLAGMGLPPPIDPRGYTIHDLRRAYPVELQPFSDADIAEVVYQQHFSRMSRQAFFSHFLRELCQ